MARSIKNNFSLSLTNTVVGLLYPVVTFPYISRVLHPDGVGLIQFLQSVVSYFALFAALGIPLYAVKEIAKYKEDEKERNKITAEILILLCVQTLIVYSVLLISGFVVNQFHENLVLFLILSLHLFLVVIGCDWFYQGVEEFKFITIRSLLVKILSLIALFVFVKSEDDIYVYAVLIVIAEAGNYVINFIHLRKYISFRAINLKELDIKRHIKPAFEIFLLNVIVSIYINLDSVMLGFMKGNESLGYYAVATKITKAFTGFTSALGFVVFPRIAGYYKEGNVASFRELINTSLSFTMFVLIPVSVGLFVCAAPLISVFCGSEYRSSILTLRILSPIIVFISISGILGTNALYAMDRQRVVIISTASGALLNLILNFTLIPFLSQDGAAIASLVAELSVAITMFYFGNKYIHLAFADKCLSQVILSTIVMAAVIVVMNKYLLLKPLITIALDVAVGSIVYLGLLFVVRNRFTMQALVIIKSKLS